LGPPGLKKGDIKMGLFSVDKKKCKCDGLCAAVCPIRIIKFNNSERIPYPLDNAEELCINCGHCLAVCPYGALSLSAMSLDSCQQLKPGWRIPPDKIELFLKGRRSVRIYKPEPVERITLEKLIDIASYAPSGINRQPVNWAVILEPVKVKQLAEMVVNWMRVLIKDGSPLAASLRMEHIVSSWEKGEDWICRGAPHLVFVYALKDDMTAAQASTIALTYLELAAASFNLGACWAGYVSIAVNLSPEVRKFVGISLRTDCFGAMMIGHPGVSYSRIPLRNKPHIIWR